MTDFQPFTHQIKARDIAARRDRYAFYFEPGCGKTLTTLLICEAKGGRTLIVAPKSVARTAWSEDPAKFCPSMKVECVAGVTPTRRKKAILGNADMVVINPESFWRCEADIVRGRFDRIVIDESSKAKNPHAKFTQSAIRIADQVRDVYLLSGTPAPNGEYEYWPQMRALDKTVFGDSYYRFLNAYFTPILKRYGTEVHTVGHELKEHRREDFVNRLADWAWHLKKTDCLDLPPQVNIVRVVELSAKERQVYRAAKDGIIEDAGGDIQTINTQSVGMKLQQLCGGWAYVGEGAAVRHGRSKLNELLEVIEEIGDRPCVIWANFRYDIDSIHAELPQSAYIDARTSANAGKIVDEFRAGKYRQLICHPKAAGHGITLVNANHAIYYSLPWSPEEYAQSRDRIHRAGQTVSCTYWHLLSEDTVDQKMYQVVNRKMKASEAVLSELRK